MGSLRKEIAGSTIIHPIQISTPFAVGDVFCYLITDEKTVLVDTGHYAKNAFEKVSEELANHELTLRDLDEIWLTHGHPDHFGQAAVLAERSGAQVYAHPKERANLAGNDDKQLFDGFFRNHHIPENFTRQMIEQLYWLQQYQLPIEPEWIEEGAVLSSGILSAEVYHTPGHAPGHLAYTTNQDIIFGGDLLLEHISTNALINFDPDTGKRNKSLLQYRESVEWISEQNGMVLPGHGKIIEQVTEVANRHLSEHHKRYEQIQQLLQQQPMRLMELADRIFEDAIANGAIFLVLSEVLGYLDWGIEEGKIQLDEKTMKYSRNLE